MNIIGKNGEELYSLGKEIAHLAEKRPDVVHRIILGMKHGLEEDQNWLPSAQLGDLLWALWRHGMHDVPENMQIPFAPLNKVLSSSGDVPSQ
ncbi:MAG: hypothetical protein WAV50_02975 [Minisyncoccia bacterium]